MAKYRTEGSYDLFYAINKHTGSGEKSPGDKGRELFPLLSPNYCPQCRRWNNEENSVYAVHQVNTVAGWAYCECRRGHNWFANVER